LAKERRNITFDRLRRKLGGLITMARLTIQKAKQMIEQKDVHGFKLALKSADISDRTLACEGLGLIRTEEATDVLITYLKDSDPVVRLCAASALFYGPKKAETPLLEALKDDDYRVRTNAAASLSSIMFPDSSSFLSLIQALNDPCADVRVNAANALKRFGDQKTLRPNNS
jgi:HEAT repeat protein